MMVEQSGLEVAVIGLAGRFPGSQTIEEFWQNLEAGREFISTFSTDDQTGQVKAAGLLDDIDCFDASFFDISPRDAEIMDPQHRFFLECAWEALENAGYDPKQESDIVGVYAGVGKSAYYQYNILPNGLQETLGVFPTLLASDKDYVPTRVSYKLDLKGPSISVGTACSSSLVAVNLAYRGLLSGECDVALAAGVSIKAPQNATTLCPEGVSPDGHCRAFDASANGTIGGNGVGIVVLKRFSEALEDGDYIYAVLKGMSVNNDGALKVSYTAPSEQAQSQVIQSAQFMAEVEPETITYVETHGTGTTMGDPIEIAALTQAFNTDKRGYCALGSVKTNIGHLDAAAGIASLIKTVLCLKHKRIPPIVNFETPSPKIDFENSPFYVNTQLSEWQTNGTPRRAGVSSFGFGGTNAHVVLEEAPQQDMEDGGRPTHNRPWQLLILSAKTVEALEQSTANFIQYLQQNPLVDLADVAYTLQRGRQNFPHKRAVVVQSVEDAIAALQDPKRVLNADQAVQPRPIAFLFTGLGTQYEDMAKELYRLEPVFTEEVDRCCQILTPLLGVDLREVIFPPHRDESTDQSSGTTDATAQNSQPVPKINLRQMLGRDRQSGNDGNTTALNQTHLTQPAIFVIEYALAKLWQSWGIAPSAMVGYSIGEYVAATLAGVLSIDAALTLVARRAEMIAQLPAGAMLAVPLSEDDVQPLLNGQLSLSAVNGAAQCVVAGDPGAIDRLQTQLIEQGLACRRLQSSHAFHSHMMKAIAPEFRALVEGFELQPPSIPYLSNLTGTWINPEQVTSPDYWVHHLCQPVQFAAQVQALWQDRQPILLEIGAGQTLSSLAFQCLDTPTTAEKIALSSLRHAYESQSDTAFILDTVAQLWLAGVDIDWSAFAAQETCHRIPLPTYPFQRQRYWVDPPSEPLSSSTGSVAEQGAVQKKADIADWFSIPTWIRRSLPEMDSKKRYGSWLVFTDDRGVGDKLVERLSQQGCSTITVNVGKTFAKEALEAGQVTHLTYTINPQKLTDYEALIDDLLSQGLSVETIIHCWSLNGVPASHSDSDWSDDGWSDDNWSDDDFGFYSLFFLAQTLDSRKLNSAVDMNVLTQHLYNVIGTETLKPRKSLVLGPCRAIPVEYPQISCRSIDLMLSPSDGNNSQLIDQLMAELKHPVVDDAVAYRGRYRWVQICESVQLPEPTTVKPILKEQGIYLITGGLGRLGLTFAHHLAQTVQAKLVLCGRSEFPQPQHWQSWLSEHDEQDSISQKIRRLMEIERLGAEVMVAQADVSQLGSMQALVERVRQQWGEIQGVIHAAGLILPGNIAGKTPEVIQSVFAPKVDGLMVLDSIFQSVDLDFLALFSSLSSISGGSAVDYVAVNHVLDTYANACAHQTREGLSHRLTISLNWDTWQMTYQEANVSEDLRLFYERNQDANIALEEGVQAFDRILRQTFPQVVISSKELQVAIQQHRTAQRLEVVDTLSADLLQSVDSTQKSYPRPNLRNAYVVPSNDVEQSIAQFWQKFLGIEPIGIHDNFFALGGDSLVGSILINQLRDHFQIDIPVRRLFEHPTIAELAVLIEDILIQELETLDEQEAENLLAQA